MTSLFKKFEEIENEQNLHLMVATPTTTPSKKPVSGKIWKEHQSIPISATFRSNAVKTSFDKKMQEKQKRAQLKAQSDAVREDIASAKAAHVQRRKDNEERRKENESKVTSFQVIKNPAKLKRMKRKQLKQFSTANI
ncbi:hypothetical protein RCL1_002547 [Eukaryota sp. TZLM3-RCL]